MIFVSVAKHSGHSGDVTFIEDKNWRNTASPSLSAAARNPFSIS